MPIIDRSEWRDLSGAALDSLDTDVVYEIAKRQRYAVDKYDTDGVTVITAREQTITALAAMTADQLRMIRGFLVYLDDTGHDTFFKAGGTDGVNFKPVRDADSVEVDLCRLLFDRYEPLTGGSSVYFA